ncbi:hypothetical protein HA402_005873 [Bradysia odoriphaga]|nr:hypothetical protein HA402_005873 [Bradysia odoriphaga]
MSFQSSKRRRIDEEDERIRPTWQLGGELSSWAITYGPTAKCVTALLKILNQFGMELPSDSRSLMETPRNSSKLIREVEPGHYIHIGLEDGIRYVIRRHKVDISTLHLIHIDYDADGVKISESTPNTFWPIWAKISRPYIGKPFLVGNYHSTVGEPKDANSYILDFVKDLKMLVENGIEVDNKKIEVRAGRFLGDTPGRCLILALKGPTGYFGCGRCETEGIHCNKRVCFPELNAKLRTDESFRRREQPEHHHNTSLLESELIFKCISQAPIDTMHLLYSCVTSRYIFWLLSDTINFKLRLPSKEIDKINGTLKVAAASRPMEFARPVRDIWRYKKFKCTQNRQFLLYLSIVCLKDVLPKFQYEHLLLLVVGIRILSDEKLYKKQNSIAKSMLHEYVEKLGAHFGKFRLIYSFHNIIHLADETLIQDEPLDRFGMWDFETANASLKKFAYRQGAYLEQSYNRTIEKYSKQNDEELSSTDYPVLKKRISSEFDQSQNASKTYFDSIVFEKFCLSSTSGNRWFLTKSGEISQFKRAVQINETRITIESRVYKRKKDFFERPVKSSFLNIFQCVDADLSCETEVIDVDQISCKMFAMKYEESLIVVPLISSC